MPNLHLKYRTFTKNADFMPKIPNLYQKCQVNVSKAKLTPKMPNSCRKSQPHAKSAKLIPKVPCWYQKCQTHTAKPNLVFVTKWVGNLSPWNIIVHDIMRTRWFRTRQIQTHWSEQIDRQTRQINKPVEQTNLLNERTQMTFSNYELQPQPRPPLLTNIAYCLPNIAQPDPNNLLTLQGMLSHHLSQHFNGFLYSLITDRIICLKSFMMRIWIYLSKPSWD